MSCNHRPNDLLLSLDPQKLVHNTRLVSTFMHHFTHIQLSNRLLLTTTYKDVEFPVEKRGNRIHERLPLLWNWYITNWASDLKARIIPFLQAFSEIVFVPGTGMDSGSKPRQFLHNGAPCTCPTRNHKLNYDEIKRVRTKMKLGCESWNVDTLFREFHQWRELSCPEESTFAAWTGSECNWTLMFFFHDWKWKRWWWQCGLTVMEDTKLDLWGKADAFCSNHCKNMRPGLFFLR